LFRRKRQKHAHFMADALKHGAQKYSNVETRLLFSPALINFLATRLVALLVFNKRSCGLFLLWSMWWLLIAVAYILFIGIDQIWIDYHNFLAQVCLSEPNSLSARYLDIAPLYTCIHYYSCYTTTIGVARGACSSNYVNTIMCPHFANFKERSYHGWLNMVTSSKRNQ